MILMFLGSWRSTLIVLVSIPLSILTSLVVLAVLGNTLNIMTLGGLALAVGILVDDATVAIENTYRLMEEGADFRVAVVEGASGIAKPALISTLSICCAFVSVLFLSDAAKYLFTPQALAVVFAMLASYALSRTLVPVMVDVLVRVEHERRKEKTDKTPNIFGRIHAGFERGFARFRGGYRALLHAAVAKRWATLGVAGVTLVMGGVLFVFVGQDYFPQIEAGSMTLHVRGRSGLRIEETERLFQQVEDTIRQQVPSVALILDNIGLPSNNYNLAFTDGSTVALNDGQILVSLKDGHPSSAGIMRAVARRPAGPFPERDLLLPALRHHHPGAGFRPAIPDRRAGVGQGPGEGSAGRAGGGAPVARRGRRGRRAPAADRRRAGVLRRCGPHPRPPQLGLTEQQVAQNLNTSLSSSYQVSPNFWTDPASGIPYQLAVQTPEYRTDSLSDVENTPLLVSNNGAQCAQPAVQRRHVEAPGAAAGRQPREHAAHL